MIEEIKRVLGKIKNTKKLFYSLIALLLIGVVFFSLWLVGGTVKPIEQIKDIVNKEPVTNLEDLAQKYTNRDINLTTTNTVVLKKYGEEIAKILSPLGNKRVNNLEILLEASKTGDYSHLSDISANREFYQKIFKQLKETSVPALVSKQHLAILNALEKIIVDLLIMEQLEKYPVTALEQAPAYTDHIAEFYQAIDSINKVFLDKDIRFNDKTSLKIYVNI